MEQQSTNRQENNRQPYEYTLLYIEKVLSVAPISEAKSLQYQLHSLKKLFTGSHEY